MIVSSVSARVNPKGLNKFQSDCPIINNVAFGSQEHRKKSSALSAAALAGMIATGVMLGGCERVGSEESAFKFDSAAVQNDSSPNISEGRKISKQLNKTYDQILSVWLDTKIKKADDILFHSTPYDEEIFNRVKKEIASINKLRDDTKALMDEGIGTNIEDMTKLKIHFLRKAHISPELYMKNVKYFANFDDEEPQVDANLLQIQSHLTNIQKSTSKIQLLNSLRNYQGQVERDLKDIEKLPLLTNMKEVRLISFSVMNIQNKLAEYKKMINDIESLPASDITDNFLKSDCEIGEFFPSAYLTLCSLNRPLSETEKKIYEAYSKMTKLESMSQKLSRLISYQNEAFDNYSREIAKKSQGGNKNAYPLSDKEYDDSASSYMLFKNRESNRTEK